MTRARRFVSGVWMRFAPGEIFRELLILRRLGRGAFANVWLARDLVLGRSVALKVFDPLRCAYPRPEQRRIVREARIIGSLSSPHIVQLHRAHGLPGGVWVLEMEFVAGGTLARRLEEEAPFGLPLPQAMRIARGIVTGLQAAHDHGVLHRDLKAENVLLAAGCEAKLTDFGLGCFAGEPIPRDTSDDQILGTPLAMAPEVFHGARATVASDIWSVGALLQRMITGRLPFDARDIHALYHAVCHEAPHALPDACPPLLADLVARCLARDPAGRPPGCRALRAVLDRAAQEVLDDLAAAPGRRRAPKGAVSATVRGA